jgi:glutamate synthase domain-containing protein 1
VVQGREIGLYEPQQEHDACGIGAVVNISGQREHSIIEYGKQVLLNLHHRGAAGADETTGDGAGILFQIPHAFYLAETWKLGFTLPEPSLYGVGIVFSSKNAEIREQCERLLEAAIGYYGMRVLGWRDVPTSPDCLGKIALASEPTIRQIFVDGAGYKDDILERRLFLARRRTERLIAEKFNEKAEDFYVTSLSCRTICYKGMFMAWQLFEYYPELADERFVSAMAIVLGGRIVARYSVPTSIPMWFESFRN